MPDRRVLPVNRNAYPDVTDGELEIINRVAPYTMTSVERQISLIRAVRHIVRNRIPGCFVECGVWRGGSSMTVALTLLQEGERLRLLYLYDTFEGMTAPEERDKNFEGVSARSLLDRDTNRQGVYWAVAGLDDVRRNMDSTGYPSHFVRCVRGPVERTLPAGAPDQPIALLRLDTDWYESTRQELVHLYPRVSQGGILILDDYGYWQGARQAVDEYFANLVTPCFLHRIDYTGRLLVKHE
jgi:O-methyltransferase